MCSQLFVSARLDPGNINTDRIILEAEARRICCRIYAVSGNVMVVPDKAFYKTYNLVYVLGRHERLIDNYISVWHKPRYGHVRELALRVIAVKDVIVAI